MNNMIMSMVAQTSIHAGSGQALSVIDLPIQREGHTQHPVIFGSSLKGALRYRASQVMATSHDEESEDKVDKNLFFAAFGPDTEGAQDNAHAGAIMVSDARLLLLPIRSLNGYFKWVTCPALLRRYDNDRDRAGLDKLSLEIESFKDDEVLVALANESTLFLEEFALTPKAAEIMDKWIEVLAQDTQLPEQVLTEQLVVVTDDMFSFLAQNATQVNAHIALDENKTVKKGALWYEETLPPETVMYSLIMCTNSRRSDTTMSSAEMAQVLTEQVLPESNRYLQVGGNETVGMGWFQVSFISSNQD
ncbi:type III-B CRISPR module RAMP protein Cmr4 [Psychrobacter lutiphocae]|uniref:type III-B CRISPR module RAMP protein Cmr4 n=1 Tax=Psychrobacter lutiphocae TaxID=540500 RepID=UPI000368EF65|nr:type III-B CRISPR module RAMP protein Cmr4 [Psychrobacter lutiphocae]